MTDKTKCLIAAIAIAVSIGSSFIVENNIGLTTHYLDNKIEEVQSISEGVTFSETLLGGYSAKGEAFEVAAIARAEKKFISSASSKLLRYVLPAGILLYLIVMSIRKLKLSFLRAVAVCAMIVGIALSSMIPVSLGAGALYGIISPDPSEMIMQEYQDSKQSVQSSDDEGLFGKLKNWASEKKQEAEEGVQERKMEAEIANAKVAMIKTQIVTIPLISCLVVVIASMIFISRWIHKRKERELRKEVKELKAKLAEFEA